MPAYYSEFDPKAAAWLRELIKQGLIADGIVDERDLWDVAPADLAGFTQVHLCAGIGVWNYALRRAGWPDDRPVWTGSFPCQPFSSAGKGGGFDDERHLWPAGQWLTEQCRPRVFFGEQVASKDAEPWLDLVQADLEGLGYAFGACAFPSAGIGAPHIRDRTYWVADNTFGGRSEERSHAGRQPVGDRAEGLAAGLEHGRSVDRLADNNNNKGLEGRRQPGRERAAERPAGAGGVVGGLAIADGRERSGVAELRGLERDWQDAGRAEGGGGTAARGDDSRMADTHGGDAGAERQQRSGEQRQQQQEDGRLREVGRHGLPHGAGAQGEHGLREVASHAGPVNGGWLNADWVYCRNGEWRPVEPGTFPLAHGAPARVGRLRGYGNAINAEAAVAFIESYLEATGERAFATDPEAAL